MDFITPDIKKKYEICEDDNSAFALPIIRVDDKVYLEGLQRGELFMRNALYYQADEEESPRNDTYDSAVPVGDILKIEPNPEIGSVRNGRFFDFGWYIKCFYQFRTSDIYRRSDGSYCLRISDESKKWLSKMNKEHVIILDTREFTRRFYAYCDSSNLRHLADTVHYLNDAEYREYSREYSFAMLNAITGRAYNRKLISPILCKRKKFSAQ